MMQTRDGRRLVSGGCHLVHLPACAGVFSPRSMGLICVCVFGVSAFFCLVCLCTFVAVFVYFCVKCVFVLGVFVYFCKEQPVVQEVVAD